MVFLLFSVFFTFFCGPIGHAGDSWNFIYTSLSTEDFFNPVYFEDYWLRHRPVEYFIHVYLLKWLNHGLNTLATHFIGLLFLSLSVFLFGKILEKLYPEEPLFVAITLLLIFFDVSLFQSIFRLHHSAILPSEMFFWGAGLLFFKLAHTKSSFHILLYVFLSCAFYLFSVFNYENCVLLIFVIPFFVYFGKTWQPLMTHTDKVKQVMLRAVLPVAGMFGVLLYIKYVILQYLGRPTNFSVPSLLKEIWNNWIGFCIYEVKMFKEVAGSNYRYLALVLLVFFFLLIRNRKLALTVNGYSLFLLGGVIFLLGSLPFAIIGRATVIGSAAGFGFVLMLLGILLLKRNRIFHTVAKFLILLILSCNIAFVFISADAHKDATRLQKSLYMSLLEICPDVEDGTALIFLLPLKAKAQVVAGEDGTYVIPRIIYNNRTLQGRIIYIENVTNTERTTIITRDRIRPVPKGDVYHVPLEKVLIIKSTPHATFEIADIRQTDPLNAIWAESYFEIDKDAMYNLRREGLLEKTLERLKPLKNWAFFKEEFLKALEEHIGEEETEKYQSRILKHTWNWTEEYFKLTEQNMQSLRDEGVPESILKWLERRVKYRAFPKEDAFLEAAEDYIGKEARVRYRDLFVKHAWKKVNGITEVKSNTNLIKPKKVENAFTRYLESLPD